jgi:hypothetical protein
MTKPFYPATLDGLVLTFSTVSAPQLAARVHAKGCQMVQMIGRPGYRKVRLIDPVDQETIDDLNERGFAVRFCKCCELSRPEPRAETPQAGQPGPPKGV